MTLVEVTHMTNSTFLVTENAQRFLTPKTNNTFFLIVFSLKKRLY